MRKKFTSVLLFLAMGIGVASAQDSKITGKVIDENGEPVIGASIVVRGTTVGTVSDIDGNFTLEVPADGKHLMISYIGMRTQQVDIAPNVTVRLLNDTQNLDEVVVTAMGISKEKKALGYAVQDVKSEELTQAANTSLASAMQGKVSGVDIAPSSGMPGASAKITIRGSRSFTGDNTPLYVVDGMPIASTADVDTGSSVSGSDFANRAVDLDPNDIESINILKGQAASALYGMRAANGVIVITTKSGKGAAYLAGITERVRARFGRCIQPEYFVCLGAEDQRVAERRYLWWKYGQRLYPSVWNAAGQVLRAAASQCGYGSVGGAASLR